MKMNITTRIGRIVSMYYLVTGLGFLISSDFFSKMITHTGSDPVLINLSGMVHFFIGMTILVHHFKWRKPIQVAVSLSGIFFLLKGAFLIALPELTLQTGNNPAQTPWAMAIGFIGVGLLIGYSAYFKKHQEEK
ncbi:hypothetical protein HZI73_04455 [Vallitalea pronyensis]|uniref:Uncharacterized protein n=1 Tax=Vallitalea pronyensis TaxID=1348613 RepID=A0A8J8MGX5_9FIRM|nr:hypothetical protein [Vallitalea pronyensis]QUI21587.1 hypothetical protein HZI73_04455 [Vallitalea pronyensis]